MELDLKQSHTGFESVAACSEGIICEDIKWQLEEKYRLESVP